MGCFPSSTYEETYYEPQPYVQPVQTGYTQYPQPVYATYQPQPVYVQPQPVYYQQQTRVVRRTHNDEGAAIAAGAAAGLIGGALLMGMARH